MLERSGGEVAIASSIVQYRAGSRFHRHAHALGEEFLVLSGIFSDEGGHYPQGTYVRNPPHSAHAPYSEKGCVIFVKLRQMQSDENETVRVLPSQQTWQSGSVAGHEYCMLYDNQRTTVSLQRLQPGTMLPARTSIGGEEIFVIEGDGEILDNPPQLLNAWSWSRNPRNAHPALFTNTGALLWIKRGHLR
jgi:anti-sigma factor ChrR (cupin superfamily)